jgi:hypothetical protein
MGLGFGGQQSMFILESGLNSDEELQKAVGYRFGFVAEKSFKSQLAYNPKIGFAFTNTRVKNDSASLLLNPVVLEWNNHFKWYNKSYDFALLFGPSLKFPLSVKEHYNRMMDVTLDLGLAFNRPLPGFTSSVELWYSAGTINRFNNYPGTRSALIHQIALHISVRS